jgi:hypothetical protein
MVQDTIQWIVLLSIAVNLASVILSFHDVENEDYGFLKLSG